MANPLTSDKLPPLDAIVNVQDFEEAARAALKPKSFAYYVSAADDSETHDLNHSIFSLVRFRPRVLVDVKACDLSTTICGVRSSMPLFIAPAAMGKLAHPDGEKCLVRGAAYAGILYGVSTHASCSHRELAQTTNGQQALFFQLYMNRDRAKSEKALKEAVALGYKAVILTVDTPFPGKREYDLRVGLDANAIALASPSAKEGAKQSTIAVSSQMIDASLSWKDIAWVKQVTGLPVIVKGIQTVDDAILCARHKVHAMLSNHGGRQLNTTNTPLETLLEIRQYAPHVLDEIEVYVDSGVRRGTDAVIALCLGAKAVSMGRPFMYSLCYGDEGVKKLCDIMQDEIARAMRLLGVVSVDQLSPRHVNTRRLEERIFNDYKQEARL